MEKHIKWTTPVDRFMEMQVTEITMKRKKAVRKKPKSQQRLEQFSCRNIYRAKSLTGFKNILNAQLIRKN